MCAHFFTHTPHPPTLTPEGDSPVSIAPKYSECSVATWLGEMLAIIVLALPMKETPSAPIQTEGRSVKSTNKGHIDYLLCSGHWAILISLPPSTKRQFTKEETKMINKQTKQVLTAPLIKEMQRNHFTKLNLWTSLVVNWIPHAATQSSSTSTKIQCSQVINKLN